MNVFNKLKLGVLLACALLSGCRSERQILCDDPIDIDGKLVIVNRQCLGFGDKVIALIELRNKETNQHFTYTMNVVDGEIVFNLTPAEAISVSNSDTAVAISSASVGMNSSRR